VRGFVGLVIGVAIGAGAMYLVLRPPWAGRGAVSVDAGVIAAAPPDAGSAKPKKKPRHGGGGVHAPHPGSADSGGSDGGGDDETEPAAPVLTAADRALEWRGDEVSQPAQNINMGGGNDARALEQSEIDGTISGQADGVRDCVVQGAMGTDLRATITVKMLVDGSGRVTKSRVQAPHYLQDKGLLPCVKRALGGMHFPAVGGTTVVTLPVTLG
jgi:hypothetical protein